METKMETDCQNWHNEPLRNPWPGLVDKLARFLTSDVFNSFLDCLYHQIGKKGWRELRVRPNDSHEVRLNNIRNFIDKLTTEYGKEGFLKHLQDLAEEKNLNLFRVDGRSVTFKEFLSEISCAWKEFKEDLKRREMLVDFFGREKDLTAVKDLLFRDRGPYVEGTWISGPGGVGKTTLVNQVCGMQGKYRKLLVDLKSVSHIEDFYLRLLTSLDISFHQKICWEVIYEHLRKERTGIVLFLDSFEVLLSPHFPERKPEVCGVLKGFLSIQNPKVKLLITSIHTPKDCGWQNEDGMTGALEHYPLGELGEWQEMIKSIAPKVEMEKEDIDRIINTMCGKNTLAVQCVFNFLNSYWEKIDIRTFMANHSKAVNMAQMYADPASQVKETLERVFNQLEPSHQKTLMKLSVCSGLQFDSSLANELVHGEDSVDGDQNGIESALDFFLKHHLLQPSSNMDNDRRFCVHSLWQSLLQQKQSEYCDIFEEAKLSLHTWVMHKLSELGKMYSCYPQKAGTDVNKIQALVVLSFIQSQSCRSTLLPSSKEGYSTLDQSTTYLQHFLNKGNLLKFYEEEANKARNNPEEKLKFIYLTLSYIDVKMKSKHDENIGDELCEIKEQLEEMQAKSGKNLRLSWAHFHYEKGKYLGKCREYDGGVKEIKKALKEYEIRGLDQQTAKCLDAIGKIQGSRPDIISSKISALEYYEKACKTIGKSFIHPHRIMYTRNAGAMAYVLGCIYKGKAEEKEKMVSKERETQAQLIEEDKDKVKMYFQKASKYYDESEDLCKKIPAMMKSVDYVIVIWSKAQLFAEYDDLKKCEEAEELGKQALEIMLDCDKGDYLEIMRCRLALANVREALAGIAFKVMMKDEWPHGYDDGKYFEILMDAEKCYSEAADMMFKHGFSADIKDFNAWLDKYRRTMINLNRPMEKINKKMLDIEAYIKANVQERESGIDQVSCFINRQKLRRMESLEEHRSRNTRAKRDAFAKSRNTSKAKSAETPPVSGALEQRPRKKSDLSDGRNVESNRAAFVQNKAESAEMPSDNGELLRRKRPSVSEQNENGGIKRRSFSIDHADATDPVGPSGSYLSAKRGSISDMIPMVKLKLSEMGSRFLSVFSRDSTTYDSMDTEQEPGPQAIEIPDHDSELSVDSALTGPMKSYTATSKSSMNVDDSINNSPKNSRRDAQASLSHGPRPNQQTAQSARALRLKGKERVNESPNTKVRNWLTNVTTSPGAEIQKMEED